MNTAPEQPILPDARSAHSLHRLTALVRWESANAFIEAQTRQMAREFKRSNPRPRNRAMGFTGQHK
jgi:hypothetical protein